MANHAGRRPLRSRLWFDDPGNPKMTALYLERYLNYGLTPAELQSSRPIIGIAQTGSDLVPCNRHHLELAERIRDGVRDAGGVPLEFGVHPLQETGKHPTAALDRNLAYLSLVEILYGYPRGAGKLDPEPLTVSGLPIGETIQGKEATDRRVIRPYEQPLARDAGVLMLRGNLFDSAVMKTSVISPEFRRAYLSDPSDPDAFVARAIVFEEPPWAEGSRWSRPATGFASISEGRGSTCSCPKRKSRREDVAISRRRWSTRLHGRSFTDAWSGT